ncbi:MAG: type II toxin-antitoxin system VapC family toxin [Propionibacteriaceae bacterium]|nr:type II toxin-antitoxin system VapC family toxin [Propionibacteriaceae bacterium]
MILLLDTHILIWALLDDPALSNQARRLISDPRNTKCVSSISICEVAIKHSLGPERLACSAGEIANYLDQCGLATLDFTPNHAVALETLPWFHRDPFDRMLLAQAITEEMRLVTHDSVLTQYSDTVIEV